MRKFLINNSFINYYLYNRSSNSKICLTKRERGREKRRLCVFSNFHPLRRGWRERWFDYHEILETRRVWKRSRPSIIVANRRRWTRDTCHICVFRGTSASTYFATTINRPCNPSPHDFYLRENIREFEIATGGGFVTPITIGGRV